MTEQSKPLSNEKHCEMLAGNARDALAAMREGFKLFVQLFSAIVGGSIALRLIGSTESKLLINKIAGLADLLTLFVGVVSMVLILDSFRSFLRQRKRLNDVAGKDSSGNDIVLPTDRRSGITITIMVIVIVVCVSAFYFLNPLRL